MTETDTKFSDQLDTGGEGTTFDGNGGLNDDNNVVKNRDDDGNVINDGALRQDQAIPGAPKNEFEALKDEVLGTKQGADLDEVTVNEEVIDDEEVADGTLFHEHTNYDTAMFNHPGGPYLTDVDNARNAAYAERRMLQNEREDDTDGSAIPELDLASAITTGDVTRNSNASEANAAFTEREGLARGATDANANELMRESASTGTPMRELLKEKGLEVPVGNNPGGGPSGVNPPPAPSDTVPGLEEAEFGLSDLPNLDDGTATDAKSTTSASADFEGTSKVKSKPKVK